MKQFLSFLIILLSFPVFGQTTSSNRIYDAGISKELAELRVSQLDKIHYILDFQIPEKKDDPIPAKLTLEVTVLNLDYPLILDFNEKSEKIISVNSNGKFVPIHHEKEHLIIDPESLKKGKNKLEIQFVAGDLSLNRNDDFLYTLLVPDRASTLFPCFDQPDLKANYTLTITAPKDWKVLAGGPLVNQEPQGEFTKHEFGKSDLMSTYLFSFVVGKFETASATDGLPKTLLYRETNPDKVSASIPEIFMLHQQSLDFLEEYTGYKFTFQKLDFATIPIFQYGGMEHVGAIQYREGALFLDQNATDSELLSRAKLIGHETAHMWFGDLVTMKWFNDVWMKEVFAGFMAGKIANPAFPAINHDLLFLTSHYPSAFAEDRTKGTNPIRQELANLKNAGSVYGSIIYDKAPIMMRQLETAMGEEAFRSGIQTYIKTFANGSADWNDLVDILDRETEIDLQKWSDVWVNQSGRPIISAELKLDQNGSIAALSLSQKAEDGSEKVWPQLFDVTLIYEGEQKTFPISMQGKTLEISGVKGMEKPVTILYNSNGLGYGVFPLDLNYLSQQTKIENEVMRGQSYINLLENTLLGNVDPAKSFDVFRSGILTEKNEILAQLLSNQLSTVFWKFLSEKERETQLSTLEEELWQLLQQDLPTNLKKTVFNLFSGIAFNPSGQDRLFKVWAKEIELANLKLNPDNFTNLAMNLAVFGHPDADLILKEERARITNTDKLARFDFLVPALSQNPAVRDSLFVSFREAQNREKEAWVLSACGYIHHPLRQKESLKHIPLALELMEEIQRTGDIFFPKGWVSNTVGQYTSAEADLMVRSFLANHPDYNPVLRNKILQATDNLSRAQKILE
ncbi:peptidase M1 [Algoriphagus lacus]|uniref:Aminopeptidase N n=1 Tax=Algoriphagus lacus TaxID=2056311 RepID=A0A418PTY6_9BACT|nr:M1 family aminopeptidase [Algoriphagus lacus]RIW17020.1 peptidase M1 [Algoriphagus lacus]